eukprot:5644208-Pyramimonas_sp.AAC.1
MKRVSGGASCPRFHRAEGLNLGKNSTVAPLYTQQSHALTIPAGVDGTQHHNIAQNASAGLRGRVRSTRTLLRGEVVVP